MGLFKNFHTGKPVSWLEQRHVRMFREFTPSWFTATMGTGATALACGNFPFRFKGQMELGTAIWALNVLVYLFFSVLFLGRLTLFPTTVRPLMQHKSEPMFLGAIPMGFATITNGFVLFFGPRLSLDTALVAACALWYVNLPTTLGTSLLLPFYIISRHENTPESMSAAWLLPIVPANVAAGSAGVLAAAHAAARGKGAVPHSGLLQSVLILGALLFSYGLFLSLSITAIYWHKLMVHRLPPAAQLISSFLPVGALSMLAFSSITLGGASLIEFPGADPSLGNLEAALHTTGVFLGVMLWAYALWWVVLATASVIDNLHRLSFNLGWWGSVFPMGTMSVLTGKLGGLLGIFGLKVLGAVFTCITACLWLLVAGMTIKKGWKGQLFYAPCLHSYQQAVVDAAGDAGKAKRAASQLLCADPGLSGLYDAESAVEGGGGGGGGGAEGGGVATAPAQRSSGGGGSSAVEREPLAPGPGSERAGGEANGGVRGEQAA